MFKDMYRVMVKLEGKKNFTGTGRTKEGYVTVESNKIYQSFYNFEDAKKLSNDLNKNGIVSKIQK